MSAHMAAQADELAAEFATTLADHWRRFGITELTPLLLESLCSAVDAAVAVNGSLFHRASQPDTQNGAQGHTAVVS